MSYLIAMVKISITQAVLILLAPTSVRRWDTHGMEPTRRTGASSFLCTDMTTHILNMEAMIVWCVEDAPTTALCEHPFIPLPEDNHGPNPTFLTVKEYLTGKPDLDMDEGLQLSEEEIIENLLNVCEKCTMHEDLPLLALKEAV
jgi:hypothetical protein